MVIPVQVRHGDHGGDALMRGLHLPMPTAPHDVWRSFDVEEEDDVGSSSSSPCGDMRLLERIRGACAEDGLDMSPPPPSHDEHDSMSGNPLDISCDASQQLSCEMLALEMSPPRSPPASTPRERHHHHHHPHRHTGGESVADAQAAIHAFTATTESLKGIWDETGADNAHKSDVMASLWAKLGAVFKETIQQETAHATQLRAEVRDTRAEAAGYASSLCLPDDFPESRHLNLCAQKVYFASERDRLQALHTERRQIFGVLKALNEDLGGRRENLPIPSDLSLQVDLSEATLQECLRVVNKVGEEREGRLNRSISDAIDDIDKLWVKLMIRESERVDFLQFVETKRHNGGVDDTLRKVSEHSLRAWLSQHPPVKQGVLAADLCGCSNLQELLEIVCAKRNKLQEENTKRMSLQVSEMKDYLQSLYTQYHGLTGDTAYGSSGNVSSKDIPSDPSDRNLSIIEGEVLFMETKIERVQGVVGLLQRRDEILQLKRDMEAAAQDKDRLRDRSRNMAQILLQEEKTRKAIRKELPALDKKLLGFCKRFREENNGSHFMYRGASLESALLCPTAEGGVGGSGMPQEGGGDAGGGRRSMSRRAVGGAHSHSPAPGPGKRSGTPGKTRPPMR